MFPRTSRCPNAAQFKISHSGQFKNLQLYKLLIAAEAVFRVDLV